MLSAVGRLRGAFDNRESIMKRTGLVACLIIGLGWSWASGVTAPRQSGTQIEVPSDPSSIGYLNLSNRHPHGADGPAQFATAYALGPALLRLDQMRGFLSSFKQLTVRARGRITATELNEAGNTGGDMQSIGFHNIPLVVEGTLLKQDYQLKQLEYELAQLRRVRGEVTDQDVERARDAYASATKRFQVFWDTKRPID